SALCVADHIEMWPTEISSIWKTRKTGISVLFLINRYMLLLFVMTQAVSNFSGNGTDEQCQALDLIFSVCSTIALFATNVLFALRVYAIYSKNKVIFGIASAFIISRLILDIWVSLIITGPARISGLYLISTVLTIGVSTIESPFQYISRFQLAIPLLALGYDIFIFVSTAVKTVKHSVEMQRLNQSSITQIIIRDGNSCIYWTLLPNLLISRLMLNLHTFSKPRNTRMSQVQQTYVSSLDFASNRMLGNIGAPLDGRSFNEEEEDNG
ncbi:uncharacterized protein C8R40DRAFT_1019728, partial [Lentinula edodes]|uniref:uncharacterized protein n=1 Tax=Lentinula edodes TaxID=5353 RepID=UPI001E8CB42A